MHWSYWIVFPLVAALIGYATNWIAVRMLFHPRKPRFGLHGLLPRRQNELAERVGKVVGEELIVLDELLEPLTDIDITTPLREIIDKVMETKLADLQKMPLIGAMITPERLAPLREGVIREVEKHKEELMRAVMHAARENMDVAELARQKLASFELDRLEDIVNRVAHHEFRAIELWGAVLGLFIGLLQAAYLWVMV